MYGITDFTDVDSLVVDERNFAFGDAFCVVINTGAFFERIAAAIDILGCGSDAKLVDYYDENEHSGDTGPFRKPSSFSYQREFRLAIYPGSDDPIRLNVGNITDITTPIYPLADINKIVRFERKQID
jgi:hypothetical protein